MDFERRKRFRELTIYILYDGIRLMDLPWSTEIIEDFFSSISMKIRFIFHFALLYGLKMGSHTCSLSQNEAFNSVDDILYRRKLQIFRQKNTEEKQNKSGDKFSVKKDTTTIGSSVLFIHIYMLCLCTGKADSSNSLRLFYAVPIELVFSDEQITQEKKQPTHSPI